MFLFISGAVPTVTAKIIGDVSFIIFIGIATVFSLFMQYEYV